MHLFEESVADPEGDPAEHLPVGDHRVDQVPEILDRRVSQDRDLACCRVDLDDDRMAARRKGVRGRRKTPDHAHAGTEFAQSQGRARLAERDFDDIRKRDPAGRLMRNRHRAIPEREVVHRRLQEGGREGECSFPEL